jgi:hypothetical protein
MNISIQNHLNINNSKIEELANEFSKSKLKLVKERQSLDIKCNNLQFALDEANSKLEKNESLKLKLIENLKSQIAKNIDDRLKEKYKI